MSNLLRCFYSPRLYRIHKQGDVEGRLYTPNTLENFGDTIIKWLKFCWGFSYWSSPVIIPFLYRRGTLTVQGMVGLTSYVVGVSVVLAIAFIARAIGRASNKEYTKFLDVLRAAQKDFNPDTKYALCQYDSEVYSWPVDFKWNEGSRGDGSKPAMTIPKPERAGNRSVADKFKALPCSMLSYVCANTFGRRMVYPGATSLIQMLMSPALMQGRAKLIEEKKGTRGIVETEDGNRIDTMFVDRRNQKNFPNGNTLVICSEGNSGFYEVGCMCTPLESGHSVLGWNHPGFWGSTGVPWPGEEQRSIDAVMQYAIHKLGYAPEDIVLFAWSIGGYSASWAAMNYPNVKHVVLDATFDDLLPLATARMPQSWKSLVQLTIKKYMNLNNGEHLIRYPGPVLLIRRSKDEMITTVDPTVIASNRGNDLLIKLLQYRYPNIVCTRTLPLLRNYLGSTKLGQVELLSRYNVEDDFCTSRFASYISENSASFPMQMGEDYDDDTKIQLTIFLASKYLLDFDSTHCTPLPATHFRKPWSP